MTKKLKAKWSPELAQDLNAYHNLDAEERAMLDEMLGSIPDQDDDSDGDGIPDDLESYTEEE